VKNLNAALESANRFWGKSLEEIMAELTEDDTAIRNNGGGHYNHRLFWELLTPGGAKSPSGDLAAAIDSAFGSYEGFEKEFTDAAKSRFGSGWAWLCQGPSGLFVCSTPNQDNPLMTGIVEKPGIPILGLDVWEHAYYLNYQNRRPDYVSAFMKLVNWDVVAAKFAG
jgi:superoxide dismutase, Fe-Mn family